jgi:hypothetical protein
VLELSPKISSEQFGVSAFENVIADWANESQDMWVSDIAKADSTSTDAADEDSVLVGLTLMCEFHVPTYNLRGIMTGTLSYTVSSLDTRRKIQRIVCM